MSINLLPFEYRILLREERELTVKTVLTQLGLIKGKISQTEALKRGVTRNWLDKMEKEGLITPVKRETARNCKVEYDLVQFEETYRSHRGSYIIKNTKKTDAGRSN